MKKKINILLIIAVGGLWGTVGYRFINNYFKEETIDYNVGATSSFPTKLVTQRDTFLLENVARDPFLNKITVSTATGSIPRKVNYNTLKKVPVVKPAAVPKYWPEVQYLGYMKSGKNDEVVLLKINGELLRLHKGETRKDLKIQNIYKDSITIIFNKEKRAFKHS